MKSEAKRRANTWEDQVYIFGAVECSVRQQNSEEAWKFYIALAGTNQTSDGERSTST
jgi:hypothetical protein